MPVVAVVIPCYRVARHILGVISRIGSDCDRIYVVDDCCPEGTGDLIEKECRDSRVRLIRHETNQGVGGAVMSGYRQAISDGADVIVKMDGDGQMDPSLLSQFVAPVLSGEADYSKGDRFWDSENITHMPSVRMFGNAALSFFSKLSTGYWGVFDPTNGYTAIDAHVARRLPFHKISRRYFFESDILFRLGVMRAVVVDIPMDAKYGDEISNLKIPRISGEFLFKHSKNFLKRLFYNYYLRDVSLASLELPIGLALVIFGGCFGAYHWIRSAQNHVLTPTGTIMISVMTILVGMQLTLGFFSYDIAAVPRRALHPVLRTRRQFSQNDSRSSGK